MYDGCVCAWKLTGGHLVARFLAPSCFHFLEESPPLFSCSHTPFPNIFNTLRCSSFLFPSLFFFFFPPPPPPPLPPSFDPSTFARLSSVGRPFFVFFSLVDYFPLSTPPPQETNQPVSLRPCSLEVTWVRIDRRTFDHISSCRFFAAACSSKYHHYYSLVRHCPAVPSFVRSIGPVRSTLPARGKHHHSTTASAL